MKTDSLFVYNKADSDFYFFQHLNYAKCQSVTQAIRSEVLFFYLTCSRKYKYSSKVHVP